LSQGCTICQHLQTAGGGATSLIGLVTSLECILAAAQARLEDGDQDKPHVMAYVCAEHVVAIYRGRVPGVTMAWRVATNV
jgi:hypothetical protein